MLTMDLQGVITSIAGILGNVTSLLFTLATVVFLWGIIKYMTAAGDKEKLEESRKTIIYGLIGLFVMVSVWGLVTVLTSTFGLSGGIPKGPLDKLNK